MRKFAEIIESTTVAPPTNCLWIKGNDALYFTNGKWVSLFKKEDFINITDRFNKHSISLIEAIQTVPTHQRIDGLVITFEDINGDWRIYQFRGDAVDFFDENKWTDLYDYTNYIVKSITPDEEDLTVSKPDKNGNAIVSLKDRVYDKSNFSGKGYKILRKNIQTIDGVRKNILTQNMINKPNTIYEIRYDFDLNGEEITIPENCILKFNGGSLSNGTIKGNSTNIIQKYCCFGNKLTIKGTYTNVFYTSSYLNKSLSEIVSNIITGDNVVSGFIKLIVNEPIVISKPVAITNRRLHILFSYPIRCNINNGSAFIISASYTLIENLILYPDGELPVINSCTQHSFNGIEFIGNNQYNEIKNTYIYGAKYAYFFNANSTYLNKLNKVSAFKCDKGIYIHKVDNNSWQNGICIIPNDINSCNTGIETEIGTGNNIYAHSTEIGRNKINFKFSGGIYNIFGYTWSEMPLEKELIINNNSRIYFIGCGGVEYPNNIEISDDSLFEIIGDNRYYTKQYGSLNKGLILQLESIKNNYGLVNILEKTYLSLDRGVYTNDGRNGYSLEVLSNELQNTNIIKPQSRISIEKFNSFTIIIKSLINLNETYDTNNAMFILLRGKDSLNNDIQLKLETYCGEYNSTALSILRNEITLHKYFSRDTNSGTNYNTTIIYYDSIKKVFGCFVNQSTDIVKEDIDFIKNTNFYKIEIFLSKGLNPRISSIGLESIYLYNRVLTKTEMARLCENYTPRYTYIENDFIIHKGTTDQRPTGVKESYQYYDTTLKKYIVWNGTEWTNMDGTTLQI